MLKLVIGTPEVSSAPLPVPTDPDVVTFKGSDGRVVAYGYTVDGQHLMHVTRIGTYYFSNGRYVKAVPQPSASFGLVEEAFRRNVLPMAVQALGTEVLHASAVRTTKGVIALCAVAETGKSTTAFGLTQRGHQLWADDAVAFREEGARVRAIPLPFSIRLLEDAVVFFGQEAVESYAKQERIASSSEEFVPFTAVFALKRGKPDNAHVVRTVRLPTFRAIPAVMRNAYCFSLKDKDRKRLLWVNYLQMIARIPVFEVCFRPGLENLPAVLDSIENAVEGIRANTT